MASTKPAVILPKEDLLLVGEYDNAFPFHLHCEFCIDFCHNPDGTTGEYVLVTNVWNERENVEKAFRRMHLQTKKPVVWFWIDDGSVDGTYDEIVRVSKLYPEQEVWIERMPEKAKGNLNTIGRAYSRFMPLFIERLANRNVDYFAIQDVGTHPCPNYFARVTGLMDQHPSLGASAGTAVGEERVRESGMPMGDCKVARWSIIRSIPEYWDLSPDTFVNIKVLKAGYNLKIWSVPVLQDEPSYATTPRGMYYQGQLNYYVGRPFLGVLIRAFRRLVLRKNGTQMLRGYFHERVRGSWRCDDPDILSFYGSGEPFFWPIINLIKNRGRYSD